MGIIGTLPGDCLAGLLIDTLEKTRKGVLTLDELALYNQRKNPFGGVASVFSRNQHGHFVVTVTGLDLTGAEEIKRLEAAGYRVGDYAKSVLLNVDSNGYDRKHRLVAGQSYQVVLMPGKAIAKNGERTTENLRTQSRAFGYEKPRAGIMPRIRELVSDKQLEEMGFRYVAGLHDTIPGSDDSPGVLGVSRGGGGRWLNAYWDRPGGHWNDNGAFAFLVPASGA